MPPTFACFPLCYLFASIGLIGLVLLLAWSTAEPIDPNTEPSAWRRLPIWFYLVAALVPPLVLYLLSLVTAG